MTSRAIAGRGRLVSGKKVIINFLSMHSTTVEIALNLRLRVRGGRLKKGGRDTRGIWGKEQTEESARPKPFLFTLLRNPAGEREGSRSEVLQKNCKKRNGKGVIRAKKLGR